MSNPRFSIVIPTRNRHATLKYTLLTCINQKDFNDYEIIVCDNCSSPETRETAESFKSEKIKYIRSELPLAMSHNWELAVSHSEGEFVTFIGDDDGLFPNALGKIDQLINTLNVKALHWQWIYYTWPNSPIAKNRLIMPMVRKNRILKWRNAISNVINDTNIYASELPMIYCSAIHRDLIELLREKTNGVFTTAIPDVYSGVAFAHLARSYASIGQPLGIAGISASSNGISTLKSKDNPIGEDFARLNDKANLGYHPQIPNVPVLPATVADSIQHAKDALFPNDRTISINRKRLVLNCMYQLRSRYITGVDNIEDWQMHLAKIRASLADDSKLERWFDDNFRNSSANDIRIGWFDHLKRLDSKFFAPIVKKSGTIDKYERGFNGKDIVLDASDFGMENVYDVAKFCEGFYSQDISGMEWHGMGIKQDLLRTVGKIRKLVGTKLSNY